MTRPAQRSTSRRAIAPAAAVVALAALLQLTCAPQAAAGYEYRLVGVPPADALLVREGPLGPDPSRAKAITRIPAGSGGILGTGVSQLLGANRWVEVVFDGRVGWVNGRYLQPATAGVAEELTSDFTCTGAEPPWSLTVTRNAAVYRSAGRGGVETSVAFAIVKRENAPDRTDVQHLALEPVSGVAMTVLLRAIEWCQIAGSALDYGFEIRALGAPGASGPIAGCCRLKR